MTFEEGMKKLNEINIKLDSAEISLDEALKIYQESVELVRNCMNIISDTEGKVTVIKQELDKIVEKPLDVEEWCWICYNTKCYKFFSIKK